MHVSPYRRIVVIQGHPDPSGDRFCHALARAYAAGAREGGHAVRVIDVATLPFPILRTQADYEKDGLPPVLAGAWNAIQWANHVVIVFPLWLGTMPALLKAFLEQIARPGYALAYNERGFPSQLLVGRSAWSARVRRQNCNAGWKKCGTWAERRSDPLPGKGLTPIKGAPRT